MKRCYYILMLMLIAAGVSSVAAQGLNLERSVTIFDELAEYKPGKGEVVVNQSPGIRNLVGARLSGSNIEKSENMTYIKSQGFRVQVFSGNNQRNSKDEAFRKEKEVKEHFPEVQTYVTYNAPFWRLRVGDFSSHEQAYYLLRQLSDAFPKYGKEMYIVKEEVKIPVHDYDYGWE